VTRKQFFVFPERNRLVRAGAALAMGVLPSACFDVSVANLAGDAGAVRWKNVPPLLIDEFEDGNRVPDDAQFGPWRCSSYNTVGDPPKCAASSPGYEGSNYGFYVDFQLTDAKNGSLDYPGVMLASLTTAPLDFTTYNRLVFSAKLEPHDRPLPEPVQLGIALPCTSIGAAEPKPGVFSIRTAVGPNDSWQTFSVPINRFFQAEWDAQSMQIDRLSCAALVDGIQFQYQPSYNDPAAFEDGDTVAATLTVDHVWLQ